MSDINGTRDAILIRNFRAGDEYQHFGVLRGCVSLAEGIADSTWKIRETWKSGERTRLFIVEQSADDGGLFFLDADSLRKGAVGKDQVCR